MSETSETAIHTLWRTFKANPTPRLREELAVTYTPLVRRIAGRLGGTMPIFVDGDDLVSSGLVGLLDAIERYNPEQNVKFETYATIRIRGAIVDELRRFDWVPRSVRKVNQRINDAHTQLYDRLGRSPTQVELAKMLHMSKLELQNNLHLISYSQMFSLNQTFVVNDSENTLADTIPDLNACDPQLNQLSVEQTNLLALMVEQLGEQERVVVTLYYYEDFTFTQISEILDVSKTRACQIHASALRRLRENSVDGV